MAKAAPGAPASREHASWEANIASSCQLLEQSYLGVATAAFQTGLIAFDMMGAVTRKNLIVAKKEQALTLVTTLYLKMLARPTEASSVMEKFLKILGKEAALDSLREELGKLAQGSSPEVAFQKKMCALAALLEGCLGMVSTECLAKGLIDQETYQKTTDAGADHTSHYIRKILSAVGDKIEQDPKNLEVFIKAVLEPMGDFAAHLITKLRAGVTNDQEKKQVPKYTEPLAMVIDGEDTGEDTDNYQPDVN